MYTDAQDFQPVGQVIQGSGQNLGVSVYVGGSMKKDLPWKCASSLKRHLRMERRRRDVLVACPARFGARSLKGSGFCSKMRRRSFHIGAGGIKI
jgi:hypothetical protein